MSMQNKGEDTNESGDHHGNGAATGSVDSAGTGGASNPGAIGESVAGEDGQQPVQLDSQQGAMPPSQTNDDQYDQGTVQRES
jgi:hypothetical protein